MTFRTRFPARSTSSVVGVATDVDVSNSAVYSYGDAASFTCSTTTETCEWAFSRSSWCRRRRP